MDTTHPQTAWNRGSNRRGRAASNRSNSDDVFAVRALLKGLQLVSCFDADHSEWSLNELSVRTGLPKPTTYRLVRNLESMGFLVFDQGTGKYYLGPAMIRAAYLAQSHSELTRVAHPHLEQLARETGETATLACPTPDGAIIADEVLTSNVFKPVLPFGRVISNLANAHCKLYAAFLAPDQRADLLARPLKRLTEYTIADPQDLAMEFDKIVSEGVAFDLQEQSLGVCAVAAPVRDFAGEIKASIGVVAPNERFGPGEIVRYAKAARGTAAILAQYLGYKDK